MSARVRALGYSIMEVRDLDAWQDFLSDFLGLMVAERSDDRMLLRMDEYVYRFDLRKADEDRITAIGYDAGDQASLDEITKRLHDRGYQTTVASRQQAAARQVDALVTFRDPDDNFDIELYWGLGNATPRFVSPTDASFVTKGLGMGHALQVVTSEEKYRELYLDILGFRLSDHITFGETQGVFMHCNPRHHSMAITEGPGRKLGVGHFMFQVTDLDTVGRAYDRVVDGDYPLYSTLGKHTNDKMVSMYVGGPSGLGFEYGFGGLEIDDETWLPTRYDAAHYWGHKRTPARAAADKA